MNNDHVEKNNMDTSIDFTSQKSVVRSIYRMISNFIEEFRNTVAFEKCEDDHSVPECFSTEEITRCLYSCRLDIPEDVFVRLRDICENYLPQMNYKNQFGTVIWDRAFNEVHGLFPSYIFLSEEKELNDKADAMTGSYPEDPIEEDMREYRNNFEADIDYEIDECDEIDPDEYYDDSDEHPWLNSWNPKAAFEDSLKVKFVELVADKAYDLLMSALKDYIPKKVQPE